jgi:ferredoxin
MPYSAVDDSLAGIMPLHADHRQDLRMSRQAEQILADLEKNRSALSKKGVAFGRSRLAVDAANCRYCGMCLYGCPYNLIYSSARTLEELQRHPAFRYAHSLSVESVSEKDGGVSVVARSLPSGKTETLQADRIFLAAGAVGTAKILMRSLGIFDREIEFQDSQYFLAPMVRFQRTAGVETERLHTLSQIALVVRDADIGPKSVEMLIYTYNDMFERALAKVMPVQTIRRMFLSRTFVVQGYLPSEFSDPLLMSLSRSGELKMSSRENPLRKTAIRKVGAKLRSIQSAMGAFQVPGFTQLGAPGKSYHIGASFPMKQNPEALETDILGRLPAFGKVHLVDASCLPSIPSTNITLSVMANAMRIAEAAMQS